MLTRHEEEAALAAVAGEAALAEELAVAGRCGPGNMQPVSWPRATRKAISSYPVRPGAQTERRPAGLIGRGIQTFEFGVLVMAGRYD